MEGTATIASRIALGHYGSMPCLLLRWYIGLCPALETLGLEASWARGAALEYLLNYYSTYVVTN